MKKCISCGAENQDDAIFCEVCGVSFDEVKPEECCQAADEAANECEPCEAAEEVTEEEADGCSCREPGEDSECTCEEAGDSEYAGDDEGVQIEAGEFGENVPEVEEAEKAPKKGGWTGVTTTIVIVAVVVVLALLGFLAWHLGWAKTAWDKVRPKTKSVCVMEDYSVIEIPESAVATVDAETEEYITSMLAGEELTDEWVQEYSAGDPKTDAQTVDEFKQYIHDFIYDYYVNAAVLSKLKELTTVKSYDEVALPMLMDYAVKSLESAGMNYGMSADMIAMYSGYESAEDYAREQAQDSLETIMIFDKILKDKKISYTDQDLDDAIQLYIDDYGYTDSFETLDAFKETVGESWLYVFEHLQYKNQLAMDAVRENVVLVPATDIQEETTAAAN